MSHSPETTLILGAGPCGLACANELDRLGQRSWTLIEQSASAGGLASSVLDRAGFTWDLGGHVVFSHFGAFDALIGDLFAPYELLRHDRSSFIRFRDRWIPYPLQQHLTDLPPQDAEACLASLPTADNTAPSPGTDLHTWLNYTYGQHLAQRFFIPYNTKIWTVEPAVMGSTWVAERVAPPTNAAGGSRRWGPNSTFLFPAAGGTGEIWRRLAARLGHRIRHQAAAAAIDTGRRQVRTTNGDEHRYEHLVSTMPVDQLIARITDAPRAVRAAARRLRRTSVMMVGLGYNAPTTDQRSWLYFPDEHTPFYRATNFSKYAPANVPGAATDRLCSWMTEVAIHPCTSIDRTALAASCDAALRRHDLVPAAAQLASVHVEHIPYAYPIPMLDRDDALAQIEPWLEQRGVLSRGRFGTWRYEIGNMDHAVKMGIDAAARIVNGSPEQLLDGHWPLAAERGP